MEEALDHLTPFLPGGDRLVRQWAGGLLLAAGRQEAASRKPVDLPAEAGDTERLRALVHSGEPSAAR
ncbi:hypothetical protein [Actinoallomurus iriomotensis]|uniref:hypothetical protein n=1 Tax=Actinoallomurus iriomotensis TaxID=478107 RepID=UPI002555A1A6|nr:hypothetical protein [Actinoallomurus iriomotensis]